MRPVPPPLVASNVARALTRPQQEEEAAALEQQILELQWELRQEREYYRLNREGDAEEDAEEDGEEGGDSEAQLSPDEAEASPEMAEPVVPPPAAKQEKQEQESDDDTWGSWGTCGGRVATADPYV